MQEFSTTENCLRVELKHVRRGRFVKSTSNPEFAAPGNTRTTNRALCKPGSLRGFRRGPRVATRPRTIPLLCPGAALCSPVSLVQFCLAVAYIAPFRALRYNPDRVPLSDVATQPYDKITPVMQERYYAANPYNLVRIILGKREPSDGPRNNPYTRAAVSFADWRRNGVFLHDEHPSLYRYVQSFAAPDGRPELQRRGFIALGKLEDYPAKVVFPHERTLAGPKTDRLDLLRATRAHFGQIFMLYSDPADQIGAALASAPRAEMPPDMEMRDEYNVLHQLWKISDPSLVELVQTKMQDKQLIIADGHHRYETALNYRNERRARAEEAVFDDPGKHSAENRRIRHRSGELAPYEMAMMTFINMDGAGIVILPTHRVVDGLGSFSADAFKAGARSHFSVEEVDPSLDSARARIILREAGHAGTAILGVTTGRAFLFDTPKSLGSHLLAGLSLRQQSLDVVLLHKCLLEAVLGISEEAIRSQQHVSYVRDVDEALSRVRSGGANIAFLVNPVRMGQVRDIALDGEVLPQKSTDFYPKLLSGLAIYALD
jgi:uncharacterized protein (DUF1015 family)